MSASTLAVRLRYDAKSRLWIYSVGRKAQCHVHISRPLMGVANATITTLFVAEPYRGQKIGQRLLVNVLRHLYRRKKVYRVELSDCSLRCRKPHNIYRNAGFYYVSDDNLMRANLRHALQHCQ